MYVEIKRCKDQELSVKLEEAAAFYGSMVLSRQMNPYVEVEIKLLKSMRDYGFCMCTDLVNAHGKPRSFEIALKSTLSEEDMFKTLAHEMIHVRQFATGQLAEDHTRWCKIKIDEDTPYNDLPWEVEAVCMEVVLYANYTDWINSHADA